MSQHNDEYQNSLRRSSAVRRERARREAQRLSNNAKAPNDYVKRVPASRTTRERRDIIAQSQPPPPSHLPPQDPFSISVTPFMQAVFGLVILVLVGVMIVIALASNWGSIWATITGAPPSTQLITPPAQIKPIAQPTVGTRVIANAPPPTKKIGIISGHRGNDSGSVCADGWTEAELVYQTSVGVASQLRARGYSVDILDEYDNRLEGYNARLLLSIHADSCTYYHEYLTGFKIARSEISAIPETEDKLVACLRDRYGKATGLKWNANTITHNMTLYHAHRKVTTQTPSVIFELGFMYLDREILQKRNGKLVDGIVEGVMCFTENDTK